MLLRLYNLNFNGDEHLFTPEQCNSLRLLNLKCVVESKILQINYTTYDVHRAYDCLQPNRLSFLMTLSREDDPDRHPFWYCQLLKAFHIEVHFCPGGISSPREVLEVLWVRWLGIDPGYKWSFRQCALPKVGFMPEQGDSPAFSFLDPSLVIHGCHLIPTFADGRTIQLLWRGPSVARHHNETDDWMGYYVNM